MTQFFKGNSAKNNSSKLPDKRKFNTQKSSNPKFSQNSKSLPAKAAQLPQAIASNQLWIYGKHPVKAALLNKKRKIFKILAAGSHQKELENFINEHQLIIDRKIISFVSNEEISLQFPNKVTHQGFAVLCSHLNFISDNEFLAQMKNQNFGNILILDQLTDPHNIGAIIRSAAAFNVNKIILSKQHFSGENATICKTSSGLIETVDIILAGNLNHFIEKLKEHDYWVIGLDGYGKDDFSQIKNYEKICLVVGSEGDGIRQLVKKNCDLLVRIPTSNTVESLNASNAATIALYEIARNQQS